jgi:hypothetical protein
MARICNHRARQTPVTEIARSIRAWGMGLKSTIFFWLVTAATVMQEHLRNRCDHSNMTVKAIYFDVIEIEPTKNYRSFEPRQEIKRTSKPGFASYT